MITCFRFTFLFVSQQIHFFILCGILINFWLCGQITWDKDQHIQSCKREMNIRPFNAALGIWMSHEISVKCKVNSVHKSAS